MLVRLLAWSAWFSCVSLVTKLAHDRRGRPWRASFENLVGQACKTSTCVRFVCFVGVQRGVGEARIQFGSARRDGSGVSDGSCSARKQAFSARICARESALQVLRHVFGVDSGGRDPHTSPTFERRTPKRSPHPTSSFERQRRIFEPLTSVRVARRSPRSRPPRRTQLRRQGLAKPHLQTYLRCLRELDPEVLSWYAPSAPATLCAMQMQVAAVWGSEPQDL